MGIQFYETKSQTTMKFLLIGALAIAAVMAEPEADADAAVYYGGYYGHPGYYGYGGYRSGYYGYGLYNRGYYGGYYGYPYATGYGYARHFGKRSADAEPESDTDAAVYYGGYYGHPGYYGYGSRYY